MGGIGLHVGTSNKTTSATTQEISSDGAKRARMPIVVGAAVDEQQPLLGVPEHSELNTLTPFEIASILAVILLGEFLAAMDNTLVLAAGPTISSHFNRLDDLNWLTTAYTLGVSVVQPMLGKLSDVFGRKQTLMVSYTLFGVGRMVCGLSNSMTVIIIGRAIGGTGGAGMMTIASIVVTDLVPKRDIALWRSYVNLIMTLGRSLGGPVGGLLVDYLGWRWLFLWQVPFVALAIVLVAFRMDLPTGEGIDSAEGKPLKAQLRRIDFLGSVLVAISVVSGMLLLDMGGQKFAWKSVYTAILSVSTAVFGVFFFVVEAYVAPEPVFSLHLLQYRDVVLSYLIMPLQGVAQVGMMFFVPLYFQVTAQASNTVAGAHLAPAVVGNAIGGIFAGIFIRRTGRYKLLAVSAGLIGSVCYILMLLRWKGHTNFWESLEIIPGGLGMGLVQSVIFVAMAGGIEPKDMAMATSGLFQVMNVGIAVGVTASSSTLRLSLQHKLAESITGPNATKIIDKVMSDISYVGKLEGNVREAVVSSYVSSLQYTYLLSLICSLLSFTASLFLTNRQL